MAPDALKVYGTRMCKGNIVMDAIVTALHLAASGGGHPAICKMLIDHEAPVNARSSKKQTPLCLAAQKGFAKVVRLLLEYGADANNDDEGKYTPLHLAASNGYEHCVDLLLKAGARVDAFTRNGVTPLHYAVQGAHATVVKLLISAGAAVNCNRKPLLLIAVDDGEVEVVQILLDAHAAIDCKANIKAMLDKDTEVSDYLTPLHLAVSKAHQKVVGLLLRRGASINDVTTKGGWSALDFAVLNGHAECAVTLLEHGATVTDSCKRIGRNNTPTLIACAIMVVAIRIMATQLPHPHTDMIRVELCAIIVSILDKDRIEVRKYLRLSRLGNSRFSRFYLTFFFIKTPFVIKISMIFGAIEILKISMTKGVLN